MIALSTSKLGLNAMFYLAAAVSDFYVPWKSMVGVKYNNNDLFWKLMHRASLVCV